MSVQLPVVVSCRINEAFPLLLKQDTYHLFTKDRFNAPIRFSSLGR